MSPPPCRSPADALGGEGTGAGLKHPQESRGSGAPSPACARSSRRWAGSLQRRYLVPPEKQVSLFSFSSSFSAYFTSPCGGCRGTPHPCPPTIFPPRSGAQPAGRAPRLRIALPEPPRSELPSPGSATPATAHLLLGSARLGWARLLRARRQRGKRGARGGRSAARGGSGARRRYRLRSARLPFPPSRRSLTRQRPGVQGEPRAGQSQRRQGHGPAPVERGSPRWGGCGWGVLRAGCRVYVECVGMHMGAI